MVLRAKIVEEFKEQVPNSSTFNIGYYEGSQHSKIWIVSNEDLTSMYEKYPKGEIILWCEGRTELMNEEKSRNSKRKREEKEEEVEKVFQELKEKHDKKYDTPRLRLWARMVSSGIHDSLDDHPNIPAFHSSYSQEITSRIHVQCS